MLLRQRFLRSHWSRLAALLSVLLISAATGAHTIIITNLPTYGSTNDLAGVVLNATPGVDAVAVFIYVPGYGWVSKPTCAQPLSIIQPNGNWSADITTGGGDTNATRIAALVVGTNYNEPCVLGAAFLPTNVFGQAIASAIVTRQFPEVRWLRFSGYDWWVKTSAGQVGPGPNYFSDSTNNVWLDSLGQLHLRITNRTNQWQCAEIISARTFGYGSNRFELISRVDNLDPNVVLGLFTWSDDPAYTNREMDIECSRWGNAADINNAQYVVQPFNSNGHLVRFAAPLGETNSTHSFTWESNRVRFQSLRGSYSPAPNPTNIIANWNYNSIVPRTGDENVRMNLWLFQGNAPTDNKEVEVVLKSFEFVPLGPPKPPTLTNISRLADGQAHFVIQGQFDRRYQVQASTNLAHWENLGTLLATNAAIEYFDTTGGGLDRRFYRVMTMP